MRSLFLFGKLVDELDVQTEFTEDKRGATWKSKRRR